MTPPASRLRGQPRALWAVLFACVVAFMGIGLVDPILPIIAKGLDASPSQVELLFTSYFAVIGVSNLLAGAAASRFGAKRTMLVGLALVIVFSALAGASSTVAAVVGFRAGWGLGIALFISTSMSVIVGSAVGGPSVAIVLFETAFGLGIATGPLVGGLLGGISWRAPFFGVAVLMAVSLVAIAFGLPATAAPPAERRIGVLQPLASLRDRGLLAASVIALFYNFGFFTLLAYTPLPLHLGVHALGIVFFAWGVLVAVGAVWLAPALQRHFDLLSLLTGALVLVIADLVLIGAGIPSRAVMIPAIVASGLFLGTGNALLSTLLMRVAVVDAAVSASATNFVRFGGGAIAPFLAGRLAVSVSAAAPLFVAAAVVAAGVALLVLCRSLLSTPVAPGATTPDADHTVALERDLAAVG